VSKLFFSAPVLSLLLASLAWASPPFGGDDTGFVPSNKVIAKCENGVAGNLAGLSNKLIGCARKGAQGSLEQGEQDVCENTSLTHFNDATAKLKCPGCVNQARQSGDLEDMANQLVNDAVPLIYCSGKTEFGDVGGLVPPDKVTADCEDRVATAFAVLARAILKCHVDAADAGLNDESFDEEACESAAESRYEASISKLSGCPSCLDAATIGANAESWLDETNGLIYCEGAPPRWTRSLTATT
jgi:hypothetical protein